VRRLAALLVCAAGASAAEPVKLTAGVETLPLPSELKPGIRELLSDRAVVVSGPTGTVCTFWLRKELPVAAGKEELTYRSVAPGTLVGAVRLARAWTDYKSQEAPAGVYTLRLAVQPESKDHEGTAPHRDFCILVPAEADPKPDIVPFKELVKRSGTTTGGTHPVVMLLYPHPKPASDPAVMTKGKATVIGVRVGEMGFGFTVRGTGVD
jgi:hypothetical protein